MNIRKKWQEKKINYKITEEYEKHDMMQHVIRSAVSAGWEGHPLSTRARTNAPSDILFARNVSDIHDPRALQSATTITILSRSVFFKIPGSVKSVIMKHVGN